MSVQTIRRKVDPETYQDLASGDRSFVICSPTEDVQTDDYFVFVEEVAGDTNREVYRKVSIVVELEGEDIIIAGLVPVEYQALESIFAQNNTLMAYGIQKQEDQIDLLEKPAFLPMLAAPPMNPHQINEFLGVNVWPNGQYSIMLKCSMTPVEGGQQDVTVTEHLIMCRTTRQHEDEQLDLFLTVDHRFLLVGKLKDSFGNEVAASFGNLEEEDEGEDSDEFDEDHASSLDRAETTDDED